MKECPSAIVRNGWFHRTVLFKAHNLHFASVALYNFFTEKTISEGVQVRWGPTTAGIPPPTSENHILLYGISYFFGMKTNHRSPWRSRHPPQFEIFFYKESRRMVASRRNRWQTDTRSGCRPRESEMFTSGCRPESKEV